MLQDTLHVGASGTSTCGTKDVVVVVVVVVVFTEFEFFEVKSVRH
jgi:hypothetical protein